MRKIESIRPDCFSSDHTTSRWYSGSKSTELSMIWSYNDLVVYCVVRGARKTFLILYSFDCFLDLGVGFAVGTSSSDERSVRSEMSESDIACNELCSSSEQVVRPQSKKPAPALPRLWLTFCEKILVRIGCQTSGPKFCRCCPPIGYCGRLDDLFVVVDIGWKYKLVHRWRVYTFSIACGRLFRAEIREAFRAS